MVTNKLIEEFRRQITRSCEFSVYNVFFFGAGTIESDIIEITKSGYAIEYEAKISRADFLSDRYKSKWLYYKRNPNRAPKYFYYLVPTGIIEATDVPYFAGIIEFDGNTFKRTKRPLQISRAKLGFREKYSLLMKLYYKTVPGTFDPKYQKRA